MAGVVPQTVWSHCGVTGLRVERFCCSVRRTCGRRTPAVLWLPLRRSAHFRLNRILSTVLLRPHMEAIVGAPELATCSRHSAIHVRGCLVEILLPPHSGARLSLQTVSPQQSRSLPPTIAIPPAGCRLRHIAGLLLLLVLLAPTWPRLAWDL